MALELFNVKAILQGSVVGTDSFDRFGAKLNSVGKTADIVNKQMSGLQNTIRGLAGAFGAVQLSNMITEFARVTIQLDAFQKQLSIGFGAASQLELTQLRNTMRTLGISQDEALGSAIRFTSALKLSGQAAADANKNFEAASKLILSNKLSADGANRVYYAMAQIASKGKLMSEELNGQLGENLAGIQAQVAAALGVSSAKLMELMKDGKVSADQFFNALRKIGDGIDESKLDSAAQSLGKLKNSWFDFKASILSSKDVKDALDGATAAIKVLGENAEALKLIFVVGVSVAIGKATSAFIANAMAASANAAANRVLLASSLAAAQAKYAEAASAQAAAAAMFLEVEAIVGVVVAERVMAAQMAATAAATQVATAELVAASAAARAAGVGMTAFGRAGMGLVSFLGGPFGIALAAVSVGLYLFSTRTSDAADAANSFSTAQSDLGKIIDLTTGKINTQNEALIRQARLSATKAANENKQAFAEAQRNASNALSGSLSSLVVSNEGGISFYEGYDELSAAVTRFNQGVKAGRPNVAALESELNNLKKTSPNVAYALGDITDLLLDLSTTSLNAERSAIALKLTLGQVLSPEQLQRARELGLLFDAASTKVDPNEGAAEEAAKKIKNTLEALMLDRERIRLGEQQAFVLDKLNAAGLVSFDTNGKMAIAQGANTQAIRKQANALWNETEAQKAANKAKEDAKALAKSAQDNVDSLSGKRSQIQFQIDHFQQFGEKVTSAQEALIQFEIEQGKYKDAAPELKAKLLAEAKAVDDLAAKYDALVTAKRLDGAVQGFKENASNKITDLKQRAIGIMGGDKYATMRSDFSQELDKQIDRFQREQRAAGVSEVEISRRVVEMNKAKTDAMAEYNEQIQVIQQLEGDFMVGAKAGLQDYANQVQDVAGAMRKAFVNAFQATEDALVNFVMTGKMSFKDLASSIIADLIRIAIQQAIMAPLVAWFKGLGMFAANGAAFNSGGAVTAYAAGGVVTRPTMFQHAGGLGVMGEAGPEAVMPLRRMGNGRLGVEAGGSGGTQNVTVNVNVEGGTSSTSGDAGKAAELGKMVAMVVRTELLQQKRPGGLLASGG